MEVGRGVVTGGKVRMIPRALIMAQCDFYHGGPQTTTKGNSKGAESICCSGGLETIAAPLEVGMEF